MAREKIDNVVVEDLYEVSPLVIRYDEDGPYEVPACDHAWIVEAQTPYGLAYRHFKIFPYTVEGKAAADRLAARIAEAGDIDAENDEVWFLHREMYGTRAWTESGMEQRYIEDERMGLM
jgi:hypothetical protein